MKWARISSMALLAFGLAACDSLSELTELEVVNENNPERARALQEAGDVESLVSSGFLITYNGTYDYYSAALAMSAAADETSASWGNTGLQILSSEPRVAWPNRHSANYANVAEDPWYDQYEALSSVYDGLKAIEADPDLCNEIDCDRAQAFAKFVQGYATGWLGLMFDSAFVFDETVDLETDVLELQGYPAVIAAAIGYLEESIALASSANWTLESNWMNGYAHSAATLGQIAHGLIARLMTQKARTPAERAGVNWNDVITHINAGPTTDIYINGDGENNWFNDLIWFGAQSGSTTWGRADYKTIGWTELNEGPGTGYATWLATNVADRTEFDLRVPDLRIMPDPDSSRSWGTDFMWRGNSGFPEERGTYHHSRYLHHRWDDYPNGGYTAPTPFMLHQPLQLIKAEGLIRTGNNAAAAAIINDSRVERGGLSPAAAGDADLMDKLIYEWRIENFIGCAGCAFFNRRGWGDLAATGPNHHQGPVEGTQLHFAVPGQELEILQKLWYTYGGVGNEGTSYAASPAVGPAARGGTQAPAKIVYAFNGMDSLREKLDYIYRDAGKRAGAAMLTRY
jgi:hypothetical protein